MDVDFQDDEVPSLVEAHAPEEASDAITGEAQVETGLADLCLTKVPITIVTGVCLTMPLTWKSRRLKYGASNKAFEIVI